MSQSTQDILEKHLQAFAEGVDAIMEDYSEESVLMTPDATHRGLDKIRGFFTAILGGAPAGFWDVFTITRQEVVGEVAYIAWMGKPWYPLGTDTFVIRDGKIVAQTFAACAAEVAGKLGIK